MTNAELANIYDEEIILIDKESSGDDDTEQNKDIFKKTDDKDNKNKNYNNNKSSNKDNDKTKNEKKNQPLNENNKYEKRKLENPFYTDLKKTKNRDI